MVLDLSIVGEMRVGIEGNMGEIPWSLPRSAIISARKIDGRTEEKAVVLIVRRIGAKIDSSIVERIAGKIGNLTDAKIEERTGSSIGAKIGEKIVRWIGGRIIDQTREANSVDLIERIPSPETMAVTEETMPA